MGSSTCWFKLQWSVWFTFILQTHETIKVDVLHKEAPLFILESAPVTSDTSGRHCSFHPSLSPCHTMLRTFASTPRCCAARSKRRARSGRPALSAASMAALRTASNRRFYAAGAGPAKIHQTTWHFRILHDPTGVLWRSEGYVLQKICSQSVNDSNYVHHPETCSFGRNRRNSSFPSSTCQANFACFLLSIT